MKLNKEKMETTINKTTKNKVGLIFGHKLDDMVHAIHKMETLGFEPVVVTWDRYGDKFDKIETHTQPTPQSQGMDCMNLFLHSKDLAFTKLKRRKIGAVANCHTIPTLWDWNLTNSDWEKLFDFEAHSDYVDDVIQKRYKELYGTKDSNEQNISGLTE